MDDGLIREIHEAERIAAEAVHDAHKTVEQNLEKTENEYARRREDWKTESRAVLKSTLADAEIQAARSAEEKQAETQKEIERMRNFIRKTHSEARDFLLGKIAGSGHGHQ